MLRVGVQAGSILAMARILGPSSFGQYAALTVFLSLAAPIVPLGLDVATARGDGSRATPRATAFGLAVGLAASIVAAVVAAALLGTWEASQIAPLTVFLVAASELYHLVVAQHAFRLRALSGRRIAAILWLGSPAWTKAAWTVCVLLSGSSLSSALQLLFVLNLAVAASSTIVAVRAAPSPPSRFSLRGLLFEGIQYAFAFSGRGWVFEIPRLIVGVAASSASLAIFSVAGRVAQLGLVPATAFLTNRAQTIMDANRNLARLRHVGVQVFWLTVGASVCGAAGVYLLPTLLGPAYAPAQPILAVLLGWLPVAAVSLFCYEATSLNDLGWRSAGYPLAAALLMGVACFNGLLVGGILGVTVSMLIAEVVIATTGVALVTRMAAKP